ncbi:hypothetical protein Tco_0293896 [Tanacetum coccineum]
MAHDSMNQVIREEATVGKNVSNKRKWGSDHENMPTSGQGLSAATIEQLITQRVAEAMAAYGAKQNNQNQNGNPNVNVGGVVLVARECTYQDFDSALTWWNSHKRKIRTDAAYAMTWKELIKLMTEGNDLTAYTQRFQELILLCTKMILEGGLS